MRLNLAAATVIVIVGAGVVVLSSRRRTGDGKNSPRRIPLAPLVAGPVIAFGLWAAEVFLLNPDMYPGALQGDAMTAAAAVATL